jgi:hypothetical protein
LQIVKKLYSKLTKLNQSVFRRPIFKAGLILILIFVFGYFFFKENIFSQNLPSCTTITSPNIPEPNVNCIPVNCSSLSASTANTIDDDADKPGANCFYMGLPACKSFNGIKKPRENCADLINLPLCSIMPAANRSPGVNCVSTCDQISDPDSSANPANVRGVDYAIFNKECIRFCSEAEEGSGTMNSGVNCTSRKCHQLTALQTPDKNNNCIITPCNLLTLTELKVSDNRFENDTKQYCDGSNIKCYDLFNNINISEADTNNNNSDNLAYIRYRPNNTMCQIHQCRPSHESCGVDDTQNVLNKGATYVADYIKYINAGMPIEAGLCKPINCKPIVFQQYLCHNSSGSMDDDSENLTFLNTNCDRCVQCSVSDDCPEANGCQAGTKRQLCDGGYCTKKINCNLPENSSQVECLTGIASDDEQITGDEDIFDAWLFRPTPPNRLTSDNGVINVTMNNSDLCYSTGDMKDNNWGTNLSIPTIFGSINLGYFHFGTFETRSPGHCSASKLGFRGNGYIYLCGTNGLLYNSPDNDVAYIRGLARANYELNNPEYKITACLRYKNSGRLNACGKRECGIDCGFGMCGTQWCGSDVCKEMTIKDDNINECSLKENGDLFEGNSANCASGTVDGYVRMRARKYGRRVCVFLDQKGTFAYDQDYFSGNEVLDDGRCVDGGKDSDGNCNGFNTNSSRGLAHKWRTLMKVQYIGNNRPSQPYGYVDTVGRFFPEQECARIPLRIGPPRFYNVGVISNSKNLFEPPLFILNARVNRGGSISDPEPGEQFGKTSFFYPEIVVQYGAVQQKMSLGAGYMGESDVSYENYPTSPWSKSIETSMAGNDHIADVFINKEYDSNNKNPLLCLYRRVSDEHGIPLDSIKIACIKRHNPSISEIVNNKVEMDAHITADASNSFNSAKLNLRLIYDKGTNNQNNNCTGDDKCSNQIIFENPNVHSESCNSEIEKYQFCSKREECSQLNYECAENDIALHQAITNSQPTAVFDGIKRLCTETLRTNCNYKMGITQSFAADFFTQNSQNSPIDPRYVNAYGWFNEICIVKGFEDKLKKVIAYRTIDGITGKCQIDPVKSASGADCSKGGAAPDCICQEAPEEFIPSQDQEIRTQTPREAGLCIDIPTPNFCPAIDYTPVNNIDNSDPYFTLSSVANSVNNNIYGPDYSNSGGVHTSHQTRSNSTNYNHAEFDSIISGSSGVFGNCNGFWRSDTNSSGVPLKPVLNCTINGTWQKPENSPDCTRYSCPAISTNGIGSDGSYQGGYDNGEQGENKGLKNGFALWPKTDKTNDFLNTVNATSCIAGFKPVGSNFNGNRFTGGTLPNRDCNQIGGWENVRNACARIICPAMTIESGNLSANPQTQSQIDSWNENGGAEFLSVAASRDINSIRPESVSVGTCNNNLGFVQISENFPPTRKCNHLGQWGETENPCASQCAAIDNSRSDASHGFATWDEAVGVWLGGSLTVEAKACKTGYLPHAYAPIDPQTDTQSLPTRNCQSVAVDNGWSTVWQGVSNPCTNKCLGQADFANILPANQRANPEYNKGITREKVSALFTNPGSDGVTRSSDGTIAIYWDSAEPGEDVYYESCSLSPFNASQFGENRTNGCVRLKRHCNVDRTWGSVVPVCIADGGQVGNATYSDRHSGTTGKLDALEVNGETSIGVCVSGFWGHDRGQNALPRRSCKYKDNNNYIDQVFLSLVNNTKDCEEIKCILDTDETIGNTQNKSGSLIEIAVGQTTNLDCRDNFGKKITGFSRTPGIGETNVCNVYEVFDSTDRTDQRPTATCGSNGTLSVTNDCSACRSCNDNSNLSGQTSWYLTQGSSKEEFCLRRTDDDPDKYFGSGNNYGDGGGRNCNDWDRDGVPLDINNFNMSHLGTKSDRSNYHGDRICASITIKCYDGKIFSKMNSQYYCGNVNEYNYPNIP